MSELNLKDAKQTDILRRLIDTIHLSDNIVEIFAEATKQLCQEIRCDFVHILQNNENGRYFYINQALNQTNDEQEYDVIIPYNETSITEIIRSQGSMVRNDLSGRGKFTPGDLKFLAEEIKSDLSVPIICKNKVHAVINLSSYESNYFNESFQFQTEQVASLLGLVLERSELVEKLNKKQSDLLLWKSKFNSLFNNMSEGLAIVCLDYDLIYDSNTVFRQLTGYSSDELHGMRLSHLHPQQEDLILTTLDKSSTRGLVGEIKHINLKCKGGACLPVKLRFVYVGGNVTKFVFALYEKLSKPEASLFQLIQDNELPGDLIQLYLSIFNEINSLANSDLELNDFIRTALLEIKKLVNFDYAQLSLFDSNNENVANHTIISDHCREFDNQKSWNILEDCDFYWYHVGEQNLRQQFEEKENRPDTIEQALRSRVSATLTVKNRYLGTIVLGSLESNFYQQYQYDFIKQVADQIAMLIENANLSFEYEKRKLNGMVQSDLNRMIGTNLNVDNVLLSIVKLSAEKMQAQLATIQLIENDILRSGITFSDPDCDQTVISNFEKDHVLPEILKSDEPYIIESIKHFDSNQMNRSITEMFRYTTCVAIPLRLKQRTIGILSNYWDKFIQINSNALCLINAIALQVSAAIENAMLYQESLSYCEQLEKAREELENFVDTVSDGLKTPLASVHGFISTLLNRLQDEISDESLNYLQKIRNKAVKMQRYIEDLHEFVRASQNVHPFEDVNISDIIERAKISLADMIGQKKIKIHVDKELPKIYCDRNLMQQFFVNLIENSIKQIAENNKPRIDIGCQDGNEIFFIRNNSSGIRKEFYENIFDLFHQIESEKDEDREPGLKLAIAKKIIEIHNGQIWFESKADKGGTFYFSFPKRKF